MLLDKLKRSIVPFGMIAIAAVFLYTGISRFVADRAARSGTKEGLALAIKLKPGNAHYHYAQGRVLALAELEAEKSLPAFREAVRLNPHSSQYWLGLAMAARMAGREEEEKRALDAAVRVDPRTPLVTTEVGNYYLFKGDIRRALSLYKPQMESGEPHDRDTYLALAWRISNGDAKLIYEELIPENHDQRLRFLLFTIGRGGQAAQDAWQALLKDPRPVPALQAGAYVDYMLQLREWDAAANGWRQWVVHSNKPDYEFVGGLVNAGFENQILHSGFDWRSRAASEILVASRDSLEFRGGHSSMSIQYKSQTFQGSYGLEKYVPVSPSTSYEFTYWHKATQLGSASPPRLEILDADTGGVLATGRELIGSTGWQEDTVRFSTGTARMILLRISHDRPGLQIRGTAYLDDFNLRRVN